jgi:hypothetical protein
MINLISAVGIAVMTTWTMTMAYLFVRYLRVDNEKRVRALLYTLNPHEGIEFLLKGNRKYTRCTFYRYTHLGEYRFLTYYGAYDSEFHSINIKYIKSIRRIHA